jgi:hypothetical protein
MVKKSEATAEVFWTAFKGIPREDQHLFIQRIIRDKNLRRDLMDLALIEERRDEPGRSMREYLAESVEKK